MMLIFKIILSNQNILKLRNKKLKKEIQNLQINCNQLQKNIKNTILWWIILWKNKKRKDNNLKKKLMMKKWWNNGVSKIQQLYRPYVGEKKENNKWKKSKLNKIWQLLKDIKDLKINTNDFPLILINKVLQLIKTYVFYCDWSSYRNIFYNNK
jgi:hypothetical protein